MQVAFDVTAVIAGSTGVARYATELGTALESQGVGLRRYALGRAAFPPPPGVRRVRIPLRVFHRLWSSVERPKIDWFIPDSDLIHTLDLVAPPTRRPSVATVHDLDALDSPAWHPPHTAALQQAQLDSLRRTTVIIANSHTTKASLCKRGIDEARVVVASLGRTQLHPCSKANDPTSIDGRPYALAVGSLDVRKGQDVLIKAMRQVPGAVAVLAGPDGWQADQIRQAAHTADVLDRVRFVGHVTDQQLARLYREAAVVCVPSRSEGFGLAVLEGMAAGTPVIASDLPATREVGGEVPYFVPAEDVTALARAITDLLSDAQRRDAMSALGQQRARLYSWDDVAQLTISAYEMAIGAASVRS